MRLLAPLVRLVRHAQEWREAKRAAHDAAKLSPKPAKPYDHGKLTVSFEYWMNRLAREDRERYGKFYD